MTATHGRDGREITNTQIRNLRAEALAAGDYEQVDLCNLALSTSTDDQDGHVVALADVFTPDDARAECARVIDDALAQDDESGCEAVTALTAVTQAVLDLGHHATANNLAKMGFARRDVESAVRRGDLVWTRSGRLERGA